MKNVGMIYENGDEVLALHNYLVVEETPSRFDKEGVVTKVVGMRCPRCKVKLPLPAHGESTECSCGLHLSIAGNGLLVKEGNRER